MLGQLLRKKREPDVEAWIDGARRSGVGGTTGQNQGGEGDTAGVAGRWAAAAPRASEIAAEVPWGSLLTAGEREVVRDGGKVRTGLRRGVGEDDDEGDGEDDDEDEDEEMEDVDVAAGRPTAARGVGAEAGAGAGAAVTAGAPTLRMEDMLRFASTGVLVRAPGVAGAGAGPGPGTARAV